MIRPTRKAMVLALAGMPVAVVPAIFGAELWPLWVASVGLLAVLLGVERALLAGRRRVSFALRAPGVLYIGAPAELEVQVATEARGIRRIRCLLDTEGPVERPKPLVFEAVRGTAASARVPLRTTRRGRAVLRSAWLAWTGPLGLLSRECVQDLAREIDVLPDLPAVKARALRWFARREFQRGLKVEHYLGEGSEFDALREYVPGLDRRSVDWKASARHGKLLAREYRAERNHQVFVAVDTGQLMREELDGIPRLDHAINAALNLAYVCLKTGDQVGVFAFDERPRLLLEPEAGLSALNRIQGALAGLDYAAVESNFTLGLTSLLGKVRRRSLVVLFTEFTDSVAAELLVSNLDRLVRRHVVLVVALRDPSVDRLATEEPATMDAVHRAVVAAGLARDREVVLGRLRRLGVHVLDTGAQQVADGLVARYLDLKRREIA